MSTSIIVITIALHSVFSVNVTPTTTEAKESCIVETTGMPSLTLSGSCDGYIQALIDDHMRNHPDLPYSIVVNGRSLNAL